MSPPMKKPRKPPRIEWEHPGVCDEATIICRHMERFGRAYVEGFEITPKEARRLAAWLTRFADWAEARKEIEG